MATVSTLSKEAFFREALVPTGTVAEVLIDLFTTRRRSSEPEAVGVAIWEPLNLAARFALCAPPEVDLKTLQAAVLQFRAGIIEVLRDLTAPAAVPNGTRVVRHNSTTLQRLLKEPTANILAAIGITPTTPRAAWVKAQQNSAVPKELLNLSKWRTFSRNLEPEQVLMDIKLPQYLGHAKTLWSHGGQQKAEKLWQACFSGPASGIVGRKPQGAIPENIEVEVLRSRFLEVTAVFNPLEHIKMDAAVIQTLAPELQERMSRQQKTLQCSYTALPSAVNECANWLAGLERSVPDLRALYEAGVADLKANALVEKLKSQFSDEEIVLLRKRLG